MFGADAPQPSRREVHFSSIDELVAEIERIVAAHAVDRLRAAGRWTPAQICEHLAKLIEFSYDGFPFTARWHIRAVSHAAKWIAWKPFVRWVFRPGYTLQGTERALMPADNTTFDAAAARLRAAVARMQRGEPMLEASPFEGRITHEQWVFVHLRHAELHLSFLHVGA